MIQIRNLFALTDLIMHHEVRRDGLWYCRPLTSSYWLLTVAAVVRNQMMRYQGRLLPPLPTMVHASEGLSRDWVSTYFVVL